MRRARHGVDVPSWRVSLGAECSENGERALGPDKDVRRALSARLGSDEPERADVAEVTAREKPSDPSEQATRVSAGTRRLDAGNHAERGALRTERAIQQRGD